MRENIYRFVFFFLISVAGLICAKNAFSQTLMISPSHCLAPCEVRVEMRVAENKQNRWWSISFATDGLEGGSSGGSLDGQGVVPECTQNLRPCFRVLRESGTWIFIGCVHRLEGEKLKPICTQQEVYVRELWMPISSVTFAKHPTTPTGMTVQRSAEWRAIRFGTSTSVKSAAKSSFAAFLSSLRFHSTHPEKSLRVDRNVLVQVGEWSGSGVILETGYVLTNYHLIGAETFVNGEPAEVVRFDEKHDLALLKGETPKFKKLKFAQVQLGEAVYYVGNPGHLEDVVSRGYVIHLSAEQIITDTLPVPGMSGGGLYTQKGLVGLNVGYYVDPPVGVHMAIHIPIEVIKEFLK